MELEPYKFSEPVVAALEAAGWAPDRDIDTSAWIEELAAQGYSISDVANRALRSFGRLEVDPVSAVGPNFDNDEPLNFDPILAGSGHYALAEGLARELDGNWYPLGEWISSASVFVNPSGWVVVTGMGWIWELGESVEEAIEFALSAHRPLRCLRVLTPGAKPWPPQESLP